MILKCGCHHPGQDELHGKGMRVCNPMGAAGKENYFRCTVCSNEHYVAPRVVTPVVKTETEENSD